MDFASSYLLDIAMVLVAALVATVIFLFVGRMTRAARRPTRDGSPLMLTPRFSPVGPDFEGSDEKWLELAAEVCQQHNRRLGIIALRIFHSGDPGVSLPAREMEDCIANLAREFAAVLRPSDMVSTRGDQELIVGVPFVLEKAQIAGIVERLKRVFERVVATSGVKAQGDFGISMYPVDGYTGGELIQSAQHDAERATSHAPGARVEGPRLMIGART